MLDAVRLHDIAGVSQFQRRLCIREFGGFEHHDVSDQIQDVALGISGTAKTNQPYLRRNFDSDLPFVFARNRAHSLSFRCPPPQFREEIEQEREVSGRLGRANRPVKNHESLAIGGDVDVYRCVWLKRAAR